MNACLFILLAAANPGEAVVRCSSPGAMYSGVVISQELVLTAKHCGNGHYGQSVQVRFPNGKTITGSWYAQSAAYDGPALIKIPKGNWPVAKIAGRSPVARREKIWAMGYPAGTPQLTRMTGTVAPGGSIGNARMTEFSRGQIPGYSGGPLLNSQGEIVGLASHTNFRQTWHITLPDIARFCHQHGVDPDRSGKTIDHPPEAV